MLVDYCPQRQEKVTLKKVLVKGYAHISSQVIISFSFPKNAYFLLIFCFALITLKKNQDLSLFFFNIIRTCHFNRGV